MDVFRIRSCLYVALPLGARWFLVRAMPQRGCAGQRELGDVFVSHNYIFGSRLGNRCSEHRDKIYPGRCINYGALI